jgi:hypothetical protein
MTPNLEALADALARLSAPRSTHRDERPYRLRLDALGRSLELPGPRALARVFALPLLSADRDLYRGPAGALYGRDHGTDAPAAPLAADALVDAVLAALQSIPARPEGGQMSADLRLAVEHADPAEFRLYLGKVVRSVRSLSAVPAYRPTRPPRPAVTPERTRQLGRARVDRLRDRVRDDERTCSEWWLRTHLRTQTPGHRVPAYALWQDARDVLTGLPDGTAPDDWEDAYADDETAPDPLLVPRRVVFYGEADRLYGPRTLGHAKTHHYTYPEAPLPDRDALSEELLDRMARLAWQEQRARLLDYLTRRDASPAAATGTDGVVVDLAARRRP